MWRFIIVGDSSKLRSSVPTGPILLGQLCFISDNCRCLLGKCIDRGLDVGSDRRRNDTSIDNTEVGDSVDPKLRVDHFTHRAG